MSDNPSAAERGLLLVAELDELVRTYGEDRDSWPTGQRVYADRLESGIRKLSVAADVEASRAQRTAAVRAAIANGNHENGFGGALGGAPTVGSMSNHTNPWANLGTDTSRADTLDGLMSRAHDAVEKMDEHVPDFGREKLARMLDDDRSAESAAYVVATTDPAYVRAFAKVLTDARGHMLWTNEERESFQRVEKIRATLAESGSGAYLVPTPLDPSIVLVNSGIVNPLRSIATIKTTVTSTWKGVASTGSTATWTAENTALTAGDAVLTSLTVTPQKLAAWLTASYEVFSDSTLGLQLPGLIGEAFDRAEGDAFINGSGTGATPQGLITAVSATAGSTVTATTRGSFTSASIADVYAVDNALPPRGRAGKPTWIANRATINIIRSMSASAQGSSFWATLAENTPPQLLDHPLVEASAVSASTTSGSINLILADLSKFVIVDRLGTQVEYVSNVVNASGIPTGTRGWVAWKRTASLLESLDAVRFLKC